MSSSTCYFPWLCVWMVEPGSERSQGNFSVLSSWYSCLKEVSLFVFTFTCLRCFTFEGFFPLLKCAKDNPWSNRCQGCLVVMNNWSWKQHFSLTKKCKKYKRKKNKGKKPLEIGELSTKVAHIVHALSEFENKRSKLRWNNARENPWKSKAREWLN